MLLQYHFKTFTEVLLGSHDWRTQYSVQNAKHTRLLNTDAAVGYKNSLQPHRYLLSKIMYVGELTLIN